MIKQIPGLLLKQSKISVTVLGIISTVIIGVIDHITGAEISVTILYLIPISLVSWTTSARTGFYMSAFSAIIWTITELTAGKVYSHIIIHYLNMLGVFGFFVITSISLNSLKNAFEREKKSARTDALTGIANVRYFSELAVKEIERSRRYKHPITLLYLDCDNFKAVNDKLGHQTGDILLRVLANTIQSSIRTTDILVRLGGDEFAVLMPETGIKTAKDISNRIREQALKVMKNEGWLITFSMGVATFTFPPESVDKMIKIADNLMYSAKNSGKNTIKIRKIESRS